MSSFVLMLLLLLLLRIVAANSGVGAVQGGGLLHQTDRHDLDSGLGIFVNGWRL